MKKKYEGECGKKKMQVFWSQMLRGSQIHQYLLALPNRKRGTLCTMISPSAVNPTVAVLFL